MGEARGRNEIPEEEWLAHTWVEVTSGYDSYPMYVCTGEIVICAKCVHICKPIGAPYTPQPDSFCLTEQILDYVTGDKRMVLCKDRNGVMKGRCPFYKRMED